MANACPEIAKRAKEWNEAVHRSHARVLAVLGVLGIWGLTLLSATSAVGFVRACFAAFGLVLLIGSLVLVAWLGFQFIKMNRKGEYCGHCRANVMFLGDVRLRLSTHCPCCGGLVKPLKQLHWISGPLDFDEWEKPKTQHGIPLYPKYLAICVNLALRSNVDEIRFEPGEQNLRVDGRKGDAVGELSDVPWRPHQVAELAQWIKVLSGLDQHETVAPQSGLMIFKHADWEWHARAITEPAPLGEKIILRFEKQDPLPTLAS